MRRVIAAAFALVACGRFENGTPSASDGGGAESGTDGGRDGGGSSDAAQPQRMTFCASHAEALACADFEGDPEIGFTPTGAAGTHAAAHIGANDSDAQALFLEGAYTGTGRNDGGRTASLTALQALEVTTLTLTVRIDELANDDPGSPPSVGFAAFVFDIDATRGCFYGVAQVDAQSSKLTFVNDGTFVDNPEIAISVGTPFHVILSAHLDLSGEIVCSASVDGRSVGALLPKDPPVDGPSLRALVGYSFTNDGDKGKLVFDDLLVTRK